MNVFHIAVKLIIGSIILSACKIDQVFAPKSPYEKYKAALVNTDLHQTALAKDWILAGENALKDSIKIDLPYAEIIKFTASEPKASLIRYDVKEGQNIEIIATPISANNANLFVDVLEYKEGESKFLNKQFENGKLSYKVDQSAEHAIRIQPELLRGGMYQISIRFTSSLAFPVPEKSYKNISSFFGDGRDAGRRKHEGIDIFAERGTPVTAVTDGTVRRVGSNNLGGKIIFLSGGGYSYYYAHLDSQLVNTGQRVNVGDTLGLIGNTGNARNTAPHLHFGIYSFGKGAVNPYDFLALSDPFNQPDLSDTVSLNQYQRVSSSKINIRAKASTKSEVIKQLKRNDVLMTEASLTNWYKVRLPDGTQAFVYKNLLEQIANPLKTVVFNPKDSIKDQYQSGSYYDANLLASEAYLQGKFGDHLLVQFENGHQAWLKSSIERNSIL